MAGWLAGFENVCEISSSIACLPWSKWVSYTERERLLTHEGAVSNFIVIRETGSVFCVADSTSAGDTRGVIIPSKLCDLSGTQVTGLVLVRTEEYRS